MKRHQTKLSLLVLAGLLSLVIGVSVARAAFNLGDIIKLGGIAYLVDRYDNQIDNFINRTLGERDAQARGATKVVPILSVGSGTYVGAAQVVGVPSGVQKTKAVIQLQFQVGDFRATGLVPITTKTASRSPTRQAGVGVSAVVEFRI